MEKKDKNLRIINITLTTILLYFIIILHLKYMDFTSILIFTFILILYPLIYSLIALFLLKKIKIYEYQELFIKFDNIYFCSIIISILVAIPIMAPPRHVFKLVIIWMIIIFIITIIFRKYLKRILIIINGFIILSGFLYSILYILEGDFSTALEFFFPFILSPLIIYILIFFVFKKGEKIATPNLFFKFNVTYICSIIIILIYINLMILSNLFFLIGLIIGIIIIFILIFRFKDYFNTFFYVVLSISILFLIVYFVTFPPNRSINISEKLDEYSIETLLQNNNLTDGWHEFNLFIKNLREEEMVIIDTIATHGSGPTCIFSRSLVYGEVISLPAFTK